MTPPAAVESKLPVRERERTVYVPYQDLEKVFKDGGQGVFLPYREFLELWNELTLKREDEENQPPADAVLAKAEYTGRVEGDSVILEAKLSVESYKKGWVLLPLVEKAAPGIGEASTGRAVLRSRVDGADLLLPEKGLYEITLKIYAPVLRSQGKSRVVLNLPRAAISRLTMTVPGEGLDFVLNPAAAYTVEAGAGSTRFSCFFGSGAAQEVAWSAKEALTQMTPLILADLRMASQIGAGSLVTTAEVACRVLRAPVADLRITLPEAQEIIGVTGAGIKEWKIQPAANGRKTLLILPEKPLKDDFRLTLNLETPMPKLPGEVRVPELEVVGAAYARGEVAVKAEPQLDAVPKTLTAASRTQAASGATGEVGTFRLLKQPYELTLDVSEAAAQVEVTSSTRVDLRRESASLVSRLAYKVRRVGVFEVRVGLPPKWTLQDVEGEIDQWTVENAATAPVLVVKLPRQQTGAFNLVLRARLTRAQATEDVALPVLTPQNVIRHEAMLGVGLHTSLEANTKDLGDFQQEDVSALGTEGPGTGNEPFAPNPQRGAAETSLAFRYRDAAKAAVLALQSRSSQVGVDVLTLVEAKEQSIRHQWTLSFDVAYAAVDRFVLAVPKAVAAEVRLVDPLVKEINKTYQPPSPPALPDAQDYVLWEVVLRSEQLGRFIIRGSHEKTATIEAGKTAQVDLLHVHVPGAFQETGQVAVVKAASLEIRKTTPEGLEEIDARELDASLIRQGAFLAYKYRALPIKLKVEMAKNSYLTVPQAMVSHADLTTSVATDQAQTTEAVYWLKNNDLQFLIVRLPAGARLVSDVFVNREAQQPMRREGSDDLLVRLPAGVRTAVSVRLVYESPSPEPGKKLAFMGSLTVGAPTLPEVGVLETRHRLFLPDDWHYTRISGPLTRTAQERGWSRVRRLSDRLIPAFGPQLDTLENSQWNDPPQVDGDTRALFGLQVPQQGHRETLRRLGPPAEVGVGFRSKKATFLWEALAFLAVVLGGWWAHRRPLHVRALFVLVAGFGALLLTGLVGPADVPVMIAAMLATCLVGGLWAALAGWKLLRACATWLLGGKKKAASTPPPPPPPPPPASNEPSASMGDNPAPVA